MTGISSHEDKPRCVIKFKSDLNLLETQGLGYIKKIHIKTELTSPVFTRPVRQSAKAQSGQEVNVDVTYNGIRPALFQERTKYMQ